MAMRVLVTGGTGFIGQHLVKRLLTAGHQVMIVTRNPEKAKKLFREKVSIFKADVTDKKTLTRLPQNFQWLFHLAAAVSYRRPKREDFYKTNVLGSKNVLKAARQITGLKKVVYLSSVGVYGPIENPPVNESEPHRPETDYEISKDQGERVARHYIKKGLPINIIQPSLVYGPGDTASGMFALFRAVAQGRFMRIGKKAVLFHPAYIDNVVDALILAAQTKISGEDFIIADKKPVSLRKLSCLIAQEVGRPLLPFSLPYSLAKAVGIFGDLLDKFGINFPLSSRRVSFMTHHRAYSLTKAKKLLNYKPPVSLKKGIKKTITWYQKEGLL